MTKISPKGSDGLPPSNLLSEKFTAEHAVNPNVAQQVYEANMPDEEGLKHIFPQENKVKKTDTDNSANTEHRKEQNEKNMVQTVRDFLGL